MTLVWDQHEIYFADALHRLQHADFATSLENWDIALTYRESVHARWNRSQVLLSLGRYREGFRDHQARWRLFRDILTDEGKAIRARLPAWGGENIAGKRLVVLHEMGFGDTVMMLRFIPRLRANGIDVVLAVPPPLRRLARQFAPLGDDGDLCCGIFDVPLWLAIEPEDVPRDPYITVDRRLLHDWTIRLKFSRFNVGIAWAAHSEHPLDFKRAIALDAFLDLLKSAVQSDADIFALQPNDRDDALARGIVVPEYDNFADVAAVASLMDMIVCCDVAAVNVAGAIGHANTHVVLPHHASWRWLGENWWYPNVNRCQQDTAGDWGSAFRKITRRN